MLDKRKIRLMTRMAMYEQNEGKEDMRISAYYKKDYMSKKRLETFLWSTIGYGLAVVLVLMSGISTWMEKLTLGLIVMLFLVLLVGYVAVLVITMVVTNRISGQRHRNARMRMKKYNHDLIRLLKLYEKENR